MGGLVQMKIKGKKSIPGWCVGNKWEGIYIAENDEVIAWKRKRQDPNAK
jgi:hypothetical protein